MTKEELIKGINDCGIKKKDIEERLGMPKNSLSGMLSGSKPISEKWFGLLEGFLGGCVAKSGTENQPTGIIDAKIELTQDIKEKIVSAFEVPIGLLKTEPKPLPKAKGIMMGADYLAELPKTMFQKLLIEFNGLVEELPPISKVEANLMALIDKSQHPELTARQSEAIRARCVNYLTGQYAGQKQKS